MTASVNSKAPLPMAGVSSVADSVRRSASRRCYLTPVVPPAAAAFAPSLATLGAAGLVHEIGADVARLYALPLPWPAGLSCAL